MAVSLTGDGMCFACGPYNPIGLKMKFELRDGICRTSFLPGNEHQGWNGYMHGGLISTILDEVMAQWLWKQGIKAMTAEMTTRFIKPVPVGTEVSAEASLIYKKRRYIELAAKVELPGGEVAARAKAKFLRVD